MRRWFACSACVLAAAIVLALSSSRGQPPRPAIGPGPAPIPAAAPAATAAKASGPDITRWTPLQRQLYGNARRGADWLCRASRPDGHFSNGLIPSLKTAVEGDHYLWQVGAALALARSARLSNEERYAAVGRQALLTLLLDTTVDPQDPGVRQPLLPSSVLNRLAAAGRLVLAINELPGPGEDLLTQSDQLCVFLRRQQRPDGSLQAADDERADPEASDRDAGEALYGLAVSQRFRPAAWKTELLRRAFACYQGRWRARKSAESLPALAAAYAEASAQGSQVSTDALFEMADWLCGLQYAELDARHPFWQGGFMRWQDGKAVLTEPGIESARYAEALASVCRAARRAGNKDRERRYRDAVESALQFVAGLQYGEDNVQHFAEWYRPALVGGFHPSHVDGTLRIDDTQQAVRALLAYLLDATAVEKR